ncbi:MAG: hypothetical protein OXC68_06955 [Aestuariivita sp.]|nr:hypothetical protein [Aestuariivita sp.]
MFIRKIRTRTTASGESYFSRRLVARRREGDKVRPKTLLNLGRHFPMDQGDWPLVCPRVDARMTHPATLNFRTLPTEIETSKGTSKGLWHGGSSNAGGSARSTDRRRRTGRGSLGAGRCPVPPEQRCAPCTDRTASRMRRSRRPNPALKRLDRPNQLCALGLNTRQPGCVLTG